MAGVKGMKHAQPLSTSPTHQEAIRARINAPRIADALQNHVVGRKKMSATQVQAGLGLLRKVVADKSEATMEHSGTITVVRQVLDDDYSKLE